MQLFLAFCSNATHADSASSSSLAQTPHDQASEDGADFVDVLELRSGWKSQPGKQRSVHTQHLRQRLYAALSVPPSRAPLSSAQLCQHPPRCRHPASLIFHWGPFSVLFSPLLFTSLLLESGFMLFSCSFRPEARGGRMGREKGTLVFQDKQRAIYFREIVQRNRNSSLINIGFR